MTQHVVLKAGDAQANRIDLSREGESELKSSVSPVRWSVVLDGIAYRPYQETTAGPIQQFAGQPTLQRRSLSTAAELKSAALILVEGSLGRPD
jgi:hypothetical protein